MIPSKNHSARGRAPVRLVVIHTAEGARTVQSLGSFFQQSTQASSHVGIDEDEIEQYVPYDRAAWTVRSANPISDNAELCGFAKWTRKEWLEQHDGMLRLAAKWIRERCIARGIPIQKLSPADVAAGKAGVIGHVDWTKGAREGSHTDPGDGFPWDYVINLAKGSSPAAPTKEDDLPSERDVWSYPIPDFYTPQDDSQPAFAMLSWAATHAARAKETAQASLDTSKRVEAKLDALIAKLGK